MKMLANKANAAFSGGCIALMVRAQTNICQILFVLGLGLLSGGLYQLSTAQNLAEPATPRPAEAAIAHRIGQIAIARGVAQTATAQEPEAAIANYDDQLPRFATGNLFMLIEGAFGALVMVAAGIGAIIAAAMGGYKMALTLLVVAVAAFILRALVSLFFGADYPAYREGVADAIDFVGTP